MLQNAYIVVLIILVVNIVYVTLSTIRVILTLKGKKYVAAIVSLFEVVVYVVGLGLVLDNLGAIQNIAAYALGYGIGVIVGSKIEEKMALGYITVNVISTNPELEFSRQLREKGYGVTSWLADGKDGHRLSLQILTPRKYELKLYEAIKNIDPKAFIIAYEPKQIYGGFWVKQVRRGRLFNPRRHDADKTSEQPLPQFAEHTEAVHASSYEMDHSPVEAQLQNKTIDADKEPSSLPPRVRVQTEESQERKNRSETKPEPGESPGPGTVMKKKEETEPNE